MRITLCCRFVRKCSLEQAMAGRRVLNASVSRLSNAATAMFEHTALDPRRQDKSDVPIPNGKFTLGPYSYGCVHYNLSTTKAGVKSEISAALDDLSDKQKVRNAIRICGNRWFDTSQQDKNIVLDRFSEAYLSKNPLSIDIANALLWTYAENNKDFDSKVLLKKLLDAKLQPSVGTYGGILSVESSKGNYTAAADVFRFMGKQDMSIPLQALLQFLTCCVRSENTADMASVVQNIASAMRDDESNFDLMRNLAVALGHSYSGDFPRIHQSFKFHEIAPYRGSEPLADKLYVSKHLVYINLIQSNQTEAAKLLLNEMVSDLSSKVSSRRKQSYLLSAAYLYANNYKKAAFELYRKCSIFRDNEDNMYSKFFAVVLNSNNQSVESLSAAYQELRDENIERPYEAMLQGMFITGFHSPHEFLQRTFHDSGIDFKPHFLFPLLASDTANADAHISKFTQGCELLDDEEKQVVFGDLVTFLVGNEHLTKLVDSPTFHSHSLLQCACTAAYIRKGFIAHAVEHLALDKYILGQFEAVQILNAVVSHIALADYNACEVSELIGVCVNALKSDKRDETYLKVIRNVQQIVTNERARFLFTDLMQGLQHRKVYVNASVPYLPMRRELIASNQDGIQQAVNGIALLLLPAAPQFVLSDVFCVSIFDEEQLENIDEYIAQLSTRHDMEPSVMEQKMTILYALKGDFEPLKAFLAKESPYMSSPGCSARLLELAAKEGHLNVATLLLTKVPGQFASIHSLRPVLKHLDKIGLAEMGEACLEITSPGHTSTHGIGLNFCQLLTQKDGCSELLQDLSKRLYEKSRNLTFMEICIKSIADRDLEAAIALHTQLTSEKNITFVPYSLIEPCIRNPSHAAREFLKSTMLSTSGASESSSRLAGEVLVAYLRIGHFKKAVDFASNRLFYIGGDKLSLLLNETKDVEVVKALSKVYDSRGASQRGLAVNEMVAALKYVYRTSHRRDPNAKEAEDFVRQSVAILLESTTEVGNRAYLNLQFFANSIGVEVPAFQDQKQAKGVYHRLHKEAENGNPRGFMELIERVPDTLRLRRLNNRTFLKFVESVTLDSNNLESSSLETFMNLINAHLATLEANSYYTKGLVDALRRRPAFNNALIEVFRDSQKPVLVNYAGLAAIGGDVDRFIRILRARCEMGHGEKGVRGSLDFLCHLVRVRTSADYYQLVVGTLAKDSHEGLAYLGRRLKTSSVDSDHWRQ